MAPPLLSSYCSVAGSGMCGLIYDHYGESWVEPKQVIGIACRDRLSVVARYDCDQSIDDVRASSSSAQLAHSLRGRQIQPLESDHTALEQPRKPCLSCAITPYFGDDAPRCHQHDVPASGLLDKSAHPGAAPLEGDQRPGIQSQAGWLLALPRARHACALVSDDGVVTNLSTTRLAHSRVG